MLDQDSAKLPSKTYVLVHGAFHGGWCWRDVAARLRKSGHEVYTPTLTGLGERSHLIGFDPTLETFIEDVCQTIRFEDLTDVILVGHSFAGTFIPAVADRMPERLRHIVYLDAAVLQSGQMPADMPPPHAVEEYKQRVVASDNGVPVLPPGTPSFLGVDDVGQAAWVAGRLTPHPFKTYFDKLELQNEFGNGVPTTYIACTDPVFANAERGHRMARSMPDWTNLQLATGHSAMLSMPGRLTDMLMSIG